MNKQLLIAVCIIMMSISASAVTITKALLEHNGEVSLYDGDKIQYAINAASDGDVIYLTLGTFKPFTVTRKITIRGTGDTSIIDGDVTISIPGASKLTSPVLESLAVSGKVHVGAQVDDLIIRKCKIANFTIGAQIDGAVPQKPSLFGLQDRLVHRLADILDFVLDGHVLPVHRKHVAVGEVCHNLLGRKQHEPENGAGQKNHHHDDPGQGNPVVLGRRGLARKDMDLKLLHSSPRFPWRASFPARQSSSGFPRYRR